MITSKEMRNIEEEARKAGIDNLILMENAGANAARIVNEKIELKNKNILVFCGVGNNAGDGLVFARHTLIYGARVHIYFVKHLRYVKSPLLRKNYTILLNLNKKVKFYTKVPKIKFDILIDAIFGTGLKGEIKGGFKRAILLFNQLKGFKISLDCPSGIDSDTGKILGIAAKPDLTITFYDKKPGLNKANAGEIIITDIGIPKIKG